MRPFCDLASPQQKERKMKEINRITALVILSLFWIVSAAAADHIHGIVMDANTGEPVHGAHITVNDKVIGTATGLNGRFHLMREPGVKQITVTHIAYRSQTITIEGYEEGELLQIYLEPVRIVSEGEIVVSADRVKMAYSGIYSDVKTRPVEDHFSSISGVDLVTRANFAQDPVIRGLRDGRVNVMIDGMRMTPACVDGMDPLTAYIESDNLKAIEIDRGMNGEAGAAGTSGGSVNFSMVRPSLNSGLTGSAEAGYHGVADQQIFQGALNYSKKRWGFRLSGTYRNAGDMRAGGGEERLLNSGLEKGNVYASFLFIPNESHEISLQYIGDFAGLIGYPALIMDTRRADAHIGGIEYVWKNPASIVNSFKTRVYMNSVRHWMDDYDRDVTQRDEMRNMYMPMYGETVTSGINSEVNASVSGNFFNLRAEAYGINAFADMLMEPINPDARDMYLVNLGDVATGNVSLFGSFRRFTESNWILGVQGGIEAGFSSISETSAVATYRAEYPELDDLSTADHGYTIGLSVEKKLTNVWSSGFRFTDGTRLPDHMERYGYYIYQPLDGFFFYGNPGLSKERSSRAEIFITGENIISGLSGNVTGWINRMDNYIAGERIDNMFKRYANMGVATLYGFEMDMN
ncbi:MAG: TonB-dependent receptor, partial [Balneolaceae bacterium]